MDNNDLDKRVAFHNEIEKLKIIYRQNMVIDGSRQENSAEHSWHIALMAIVFFEYSDDKKIDLLKVIKMLLIHDIVEIDTGDTFLYDTEANKTKTDNEMSTANRVFGLLPENTKNDFLNLWQEFEKRITPEAKFAASLDGLQPILNHLASKGKGIKNHHIKVSQMIEKKKYIGDASKTLWDFARKIIQKCLDMGYILKD